MPPDARRGVGLRHIARVMTCSPATVKKALAVMPERQTVLTFPRRVAPIVPS